MEEEEKCTVQYFPHSPLTVWSQRYLPFLPGSHSPGQHLSEPPQVPQHCESTAQDWRARQITSQSERIPLQGGNVASGQRSTGLYIYSIAMDNMCGPCSNERVSEVDVYNLGGNFFLGTHEPPTTEH